MEISICEINEANTICRALALHTKIRPVGAGDLRQPGARHGHTQVSDMSKTLGVQVGLADNFHK